MNKIVGAIETSLAVCMPFDNSLVVKSYEGSKLSNYHFLMILTDNLEVMQILQFISKIDTRQCFGQLLAIRIIL